MGRTTTRPTTAWARPYNHGMRNLAGIGAALLFLAPLAAQAPVRLTTVDALMQFPSYYHLQPVVVRGTVAKTASRVTLRTEAHELRLLLPAGTAAPDGPADARGLFVDVGKLDRGDPRLTGYHREADDSWPKPGEELLLRVDRISGVPDRPALSVRTLALEPWRSHGQVVTLVGQFRGRNLFGDQPGAPKIGPYDFVLKSGDASVWVTGLRPRGKGFDLNVDARVDSRYWLEVTGTARLVDGLVRIEATKLVESKEPVVIAERDTPPPPPPSPPVEVIFSDPTTDEGGVALATKVRVQLSRNIDQASLVDQIHVAYVGTTDLVVPAWKTTYDPASHALELIFAKPLDADMTVRVTLLAGIRGFDKIALVPWSLTFRTAP